MLLIHATLFLFYDSMAANFFSNPLDKPVESVEKSVCTRHTEGFQKLLPAEAERRNLKDRIVGIAPTDHLH